MDNFISRALLRRRFLRSMRELLVVSFIGPDGSGESTLVTAVEAMFTREGQAVGSEYWGAVEVSRDGCSAFAAWRSGCAGVPPGVTVRKQGRA